MQTAKRSSLGTKAERLSTGPYVKTYLRMLLPAVAWYRVAMAEQKFPPPGRQGDHQPPSQPWRTEGVPPKQPPPRRRSWIGPAVMLLGYLVFFGIVTLQDRMSGPQAISYTEFKKQVGNKNVGEVFARGDSIQGSLKKAPPYPARRIARTSSSRPSVRRSPLTTC